MTLFFGYLFEPFNVYHPEHKMDYFWVTVIHSCTPFAIILLFSTIPTSSDVEEHWTLGKEALYISSYLLVVGIAQFLIRDLIYDNPNNWSWRYLFEEVRNTFLVGGLFATILIPINFIRLMSKNSYRANALNVPHTDTQAREVTENRTNSLISIENIEFEVADFVFAKAEGNYVALHINGENPTKTLKRITIKELDSLLQEHGNILKVHRSYLVNLEYVTQVKGNAQGYRLSLVDSYEASVARSMIGRFEAKLKNHELRSI